MKIFDIFGVSFKNLFRQKMRAFLTIVSMMVGAFLIVIMLSVGNGLEQFMTGQVTMFQNKRTIGVQQSFDFTSMGGFGFGGVEEYEEETSATGTPQEMMEQSMLTTEDLEKVEEVDHIEEIAFESIVAPDYVRLDMDGKDGKKLLLNLYGLPFGIIDDLSFSSVDEDFLKESNFIVLSDGYPEKWGYDGEELLGETVKVRMTQTAEMEVISAEDQDDLSMELDAAGYTDTQQAQKEMSEEQEPETKEFKLVVAGFFEKSLLSQVGFISPEMSNKMNAFAAGKTVKEFTEDEKAFEIIVIVDEDENVGTVDKAIEDLGYQSMTYDETLGQIGFVFDIINAVMSGFGIVAMLVASIGIINTLLMAIYERTREIGVMKAVGAPRYVIGMLFTAEAAWLGFMGGIVGIVVSWLIGRGVNWVLHEGISIGGFTLFTGPLADYPTFDISVFTVSMVLMVIGLTTVVAVVAGLYPAWRASRLDPIDALRHD